MHQNYTVSTPVRAAYNIPIPKFKKPNIPTQNSSELNSDAILSQIILQLQLKPILQPSSPRQHELQEVLALSNHRAFNTFLYPSLNHIYNERGDKQTIQKL